MICMRSVPFTLRQAIRNWPFGSIILSIAAERWNGLGLIDCTRALAKSFDMQTTLQVTLLGHIMHLRLQPPRFQRTTFIVQFSRGV